MSGPRIRKKSYKRIDSLNRRDFLRYTAASGAAASLTGVLTACGNDNSGNIRAGSGASFQHGVASGDPLQDRVILWTRVTRLGASSIDVNWVISSTPDLANIVNQGTFTTDSGRDYTVKIDADGLQPDTTYYYQFSVGSKNSPVGRTKTLPQGSLNRARFAMVSCSSLPHGFFNAYRRIAERPDLDFVLHLGDYVYEYPGVDPDGEHDYADADAIAAGRQYSPDNQVEMVQLGDYRKRYANYRLDTDLQELHRQYAFINIWDDHELTNDAWREGAENHQPETEGDWAARHSFARQAFFEWLPIRESAPGDTLTLKRNFRLGNLVELITLDTRLVGRDQQPEGTEVPGLTSIFLDEGDIAAEDRHMLGAAQEASLVSDLQSSTAQWKLVGQQIVFAQWKLVGLPNSANIQNPGGQGGEFINVDQWDAYPRARERLWAAIRGNQPAPNVAINNVVILTGDVHSSWAHDITEDPNNPAAYNPASGEGSMAVEFVCPSVTSPASFPDTAITVPAFQTQNPHIKYGEIQSKGYTLVDITPERCQSEWYFVDDHLAPSDGESLAVVYATENDGNHVVESTVSEPRANPPALAPAG